MQLLRSARELQEWILQTSGLRVLVPTMGALHDGHCELIAHAKRLAEQAQSGRVIVSIFVNPIQFDRAEDLSSYPVKTLQDHAICEELGVDAVFSPESFYEPDRSITITERSLSTLLCGATRPGHFDGVCTVVAKLLMATQAQHAVFGKKDYQQLAIIRRMVRDLNLPVQIHGVETQRDQRGLALSSRNLRLSASNQDAAPLLYQALLKARELSRSLDISALLKATSETITGHPTAAEAPRIDYLELVDCETLQVAKDYSRPTLLAAAVFFGDVRLIDNIEIPAHSS